MKERVLNIIYACVCMIVFVAVVYFTNHRLYFGADFTDEAFYSLLPYQFALGQKPFIDEINILQTSAFIIYPFFKIFAWVNKSTDGIILFNRYLFFIFYFVISYIVFRVSKKLIGWQTALLIACSCLAFIPFNIPSLSYNTLGCGFLTLGMIAGFSGIQHNKDSKYLFYSGILLALAVISYPTLVISVACYVLIMLLIIREHYWRNVLKFAAGGIVVLLPVLFVVLQAGVDNVLRAIEYFQSYGVHGGAISKFITEWDKLIVAIPHKIPLLISIALYLLSYKRFPIIGVIALLLFPVLLIDSNTFASITASMSLLINYSLVAVVLLLTNLKNDAVARIFWSLWLPSFIAGNMLMWSSSNGYVASAFGLVPASLATALMTSIIISTSFGEKHRELTKYAQIVSPIVIVVFLLIVQRESVYRDEAIDQLDYQVKSGPYSGLYTSIQKIEFMNSLKSDIKSVSDSKQTVLFYEHFPAGYLFTKSKPAVNTVWISSLNAYPQVDRSIIVDYYKTHPTPDVVFQMKKVVSKKGDDIVLSYYNSDALNNWIEIEYTNILSNEYYSIFKMK
jgi:hypothetical protein